MPRFVKLTRVRRDIGEVIGKKRHAVTETMKNAKNLKHAQRAGIAIGHGQMVIDDQDALFPGA